MHKIILDKEVYTSPKWRNLGYCIKVRNIRHLEKSFPTPKLSIPSK